MTNRVLSAELVELHLGPLRIAREMVAAGLMTDEQLKCIALSTVEAIECGAKPDDGGPVVLTIRPREGSALPTEQGTEDIQ